jgi:hypothetical protein
MISGYLVLTLLGAPHAIDDGLVAVRARKILAELVAADTENPPGNEARAVAIGVRRLKAAASPTRSPVSPTVARTSWHA